jgi:hypothetical protein
MLACSSPRLFAACHVLHRRPVPRHPPCALIRLTSSSFDTNPKAGISLSTNPPNNTFLTPRRLAEIFRPWIKTNHGPANLRHLHKSFTSPLDPEHRTRNSLKPDLTSNIRPIATHASSRGTKPPQGRLVSAQISKNGFGSPGLASRPSFHRAG